MKHSATPAFREALEAMPEAVQAIARKNFDLLLADPRHPLLQFKRLAPGRLWSARVGRGHRVLGVESKEGIEWFWIGSHAGYDRRVRGGIGVHSSAGTTQLAGSMSTPS